LYRPVKTEVISLAAVFSVALGVRLWDLGAHSLLIDEAFVAVAARDILKNGTFMWDAVSNAPYVWVLSVLTSVLGDSLFVLRSLSAIAGSFSCLICYWFARREIENQEARLAAAILALHPFAIAFTRVAFVDALQLPCLLIAIFSIDRYLRSRDTGYLILAIVGSMLAFIAKYNALAVLACWFLAAMIIRRYSVVQSIKYGGLLAVAALVTLLLWPFDAPLWFFSFLAKGGSYDRSYIIGFYTFVYPHVTLGALSLLFALIGYALFRSTYSLKARSFIDQLLLFTAIYSGMLLFLGRPFQRYLLILTVPIAIVYASILIRVLQAIRVGASLSRIRLGLASAATFALLIGVGVQAILSARNYVDYLRTGLPMQQAFRLLEDHKSSKVFWPSMPPVLAGYYLGFDQYYSLASRGPVSTNMMSRHFFGGMPFPYSADTLPYGVLIARREMIKDGWFTAVTRPSDFKANVMAKDSSISALKSSFQWIDYYHSPLVQPGDLIVEMDGIVDQNGEPALYERPDTKLEGYQVAKGFELIGVFEESRDVDPTRYDTRLDHGQIRIIRKLANAQ
jgi:hypothetical protein